ncbi:Isotrichodermin C-15 hydroxylase [Neolecta irregularis DAH-3]|uniref:Isotrichodermin C-15 hydroxylase n=1 Tax=Neolecta irregularis (strain DAH-3) TaxID=1198029 RepID=A0A1U7LHD7_NEOID|nr:Isotrichodermin C-15 hydroxylase [Neolecta irregularis DAH-3]|eukprot:OLL21941.1 Isotrichodermin C-15 hydroxylase [Neolecta irregularis DAH-3]
MQSSAISNNMDLPSAFLTFVVLPIFGWIVYQLYFCPLSKFPGPFWAKINPLWHTYQFTTGQRHKYFLKLHQQYGDLVRVGVSDISVCNISGIKDLYDHGVSLIRPLGYNNFRCDKRYSSVSNEQNKEAHKRLARGLSGAFSPKSLEEMEIYIRKSVLAFCDAIKESGDNGEKALDMSIWTSFLAFDVLGDLCFSKSYGMLNTRVKSPVIDAVEGFTIITLGFMFIPRMLFLSKYILPKYLIQQRRQMIQEAYDRLIERLSITGGRKDIFHYLVQSLEPGLGEDERQGKLQTAVRSMITAGTVNVSATITTAMYYLCQNCRVFSRLRQEITTEYQTNPDLDYRRLSALIYLNAVIAETLRIAPPVLAELVKVTTESETVIAGQRFPIGTMLATCSYALTRDPRYFTNPNAFIPERWFENGYEKDQTLGFEAS